MTLVGFLLNPIAGMGGNVGLKGTDDVAEEAARRGARPIAAGRASEALRELKRLLAAEAEPPALRWVTCAGAMGADALANAGFDAGVVHTPGFPSNRDDTHRAVREFLAADVDLIMFCGGDGTARDICTVTGTATPILGIPSGVKMYSGVFATTPAAAAEVMVGFLAGRLALAEAEVLDLDEERYRRGEWAVRLYHAAMTPFEASLTQASKMLIDEASDAEVKEEIGAHLAEEIANSPDTLYLLGPGSTVQAVTRCLGVEKTLLGIDAVAGGALAGRDLDGKDILALLAGYPDRRLILSPIGAQGFVLGRGNLQLGPEAIRMIGRDNIIVVATPAKLAHTPCLRFDTGDRGLDALLAGDGFMPVLVGYRRRRMARTLGPSSPPTDHKTLG
jgi:predicted polyphosphate/ATP-dependent NAD kinase